MRQAEMRILADAAWSAVFQGPVEWPSGAPLFRQGERPGYVYVVDSGEIALRRVDREGNEHVIAIVSRPALVGSSFVIADRPSIVEAITITSCRLRLCSADAFLVAVSALSANADRAAEVHRWHCAEIVELIELAAAMRVKSSSQRLDHFLDKYAATSNTQSRPPFKQSLIASFLNITPEHLSRLFKKRQVRSACQRVLSTKRRVPRRG